MKSIIPPQLGGDRTAMMQNRVRAVTQVRAHGTKKIPDIPRSVVVQSGQGGALVTWNLPTRYNDVTGYRIYVGSEKNLAVQIRDRGTRQAFIPLSTGASPAPITSIYVSTVNGFRESGRIQLKTSAQAGSTTVPQPTTDFLNQFSGGWDKTQSGQPTGKRTV